MLWLKDFVTKRELSRSDAIFFTRNAAIFPIDDPTSGPLVGEATIVLVNDARHQLEANFLQRTVPYFFELSSSNATVSSGGRYRWAKVMW